MQEKPAAATTIGRSQIHNERTLDVDECGCVGHREGLVGGREGLSLMGARHDHLNGLALVVRHPL